MKNIFVQIFVLCAIALFPFVNINAQTDTLLVKVEPSLFKGLNISWLPRHARTWKSGNQVGYKLTRSIDGGPSITLQSGVLPKDREWFQAQTDAGFGMLPFIGEVMYDPDFQLENEGSTSALESRFGYIVYEAESNFEISSALGLGFTDSLWTDQQNTIYEVTLTENGIVSAHGQLEIKIIDSPYQQSEVAPIEYKIPDNRPLSQLLGAYDTEKTDYLVLRARAYGDSIVLRWAPNRAIAWANTIKNGYAIYRIDNEPEVPEKWSGLNSDQQRDSLIANGGYKKMLVENLKPWPEASLNRPEILSDTMALVAAHGLYGKKVTDANSDIYSAWSESEMNFGFAMLAADRSALAADLLGLRFVDRDVKPGKRYSYLIETPGIIPIAGSPYIEVHNLTDSLITPFQFSAIPADGYIRLTWPRSNEQLFSLYKLERSDNDGKTWHLRSDDALLQTHATQIPGQEDMNFFTDSVPSNYKTYYYRLKGLDGFSTWSPPAEVQAQAKDMTPNGEPFFSFAGTTALGGIALSWSVEKDTTDLAGFELTMARDIEGAYRPLGGPFNAQQKEYYYTGPIDSDLPYYFMVTAIDTAGNRHASLPVFVTVVDSIPPAAPEDLIGQVDSNGVVTLVWKQNTENDLLGYRVYFGNEQKEEFSQLTVSAQPINLYKDTIGLITMNEFIFYRIVAEDQMHNLSNFSRILALQRPDNVPPITPVMKPSKSIKEGVRLSWNPSPNIDVVRYAVYRRDPTVDTMPWNLIGLVFRDATQWTDTTAILEKQYTYTVRAQDDAALFSDYAFPVYGRQRFKGVIGSLQIVIANYEPDQKVVSLGWLLDEKSIPDELKDQDYYFFLYRKTALGGLEKYQQFQADKRAFTDRKLPENGTYTYRLKIVFADGKTGNPTEPAFVEVN
jgi:hypothetical protein